MYISHILSELERERAMRVYVFPRLKRDGKLTDAEAAQRLERLSGAVELCQILEDAGFRTTLEVVDWLKDAAGLNNGEGEASTPIIIKGAE